MSSAKSFQRAAMAAPQAPRPTAAPSRGKKNSSTVKPVSKKKSFDGAIGEGECSLKEAPPMPQFSSFALSSMKQNDGDNYAESHGVSFRNFKEMSAAGKILDSPRSLKACKLEDVNPIELLPRELEDFMESGLSEDDVEMQRLQYEEQREEKLQRVFGRYEKILAENEVESVKGATMDQTKRYATQLQTPGRDGASPSFGLQSRSSSAPYKTVLPRSQHSFHTALTSDNAPSRSTSVAALKIYGATRKENRMPLPSEISILERIQENEKRQLEVRRRMITDEKRRENALILKELDKERRGIQKWQEMEKKKMEALYLHQKRTEERLERVHERQKREEEIRQLRRERLANRSRVSPSEKPKKNAAARTSFC